MSSPVHPGHGQPAAIKKARSLEASRLNGFTAYWFFKVSGR